MATILVGTDTTAAADLAVEGAARMARDRDAELVVLYVRSGGDLRAVVDPSRSPDPNGYLARLHHRFPDVRLRTRTDEGVPSERICAVAEEERAETIVLGNVRITGNNAKLVGNSVAGTITIDGKESLCDGNTKRLGDGTVGQTLACDGT